VGTVAALDACIRYLDRELLYRTVLHSRQLVRPEVLDSNSNASFR